MFKAILDRFWIIIWNFGWSTRRQNVIKNRCEHWYRTKVASEEARVPERIPGWWQEGGKGGGNPPWVGGSEERKKQRKEERKKES